MITRSTTCQQLQTSTACCLSPGEIGDCDLSLGSYYDNFTIVHLAALRHPNPCPLGGWTTKGIYLAGMVVREVQLCVLRSDSGQQEGPSLLPNAVMVVGPVGRSCLHQHSNMILQTCRQTCLCTYIQNNDIYILYFNVKYIYICVYMYMVLAGDLMLLVCNVASIGACASMSWVPAS